MTCRYWYLYLGLHILLLLSPCISYYIVYERILIKHHYLHDDNKMLQVWHTSIGIWIQDCFFWLPGPPIIFCLKEYSYWSLIWNQILIFASFCKCRGYEMNTFMIARIMDAFSLLYPFLPTSSVLHLFLLIFKSQTK